MPAAGRAYGLVLLDCFPKEVVLRPAGPGAHHTTNFVPVFGLTVRHLSFATFGKPLIYGG